MNIFEFNNIMISESKTTDLATNFGERLMAAAQDDHSIPMHLKQEMNPVAIVQELSKADPTGNRRKALMFLVRSYSLKQFLMEDLERVKNDLTTFYKYLPKIENKNLESYRSLKELYQAIEPFQQQDTPVSKRQEKAQIKQEGAEVLIDSPNFKVVLPKTHEASCLYGTGTNWCTKLADNPEHFKNYMSQGPLYYILVNAGGGDVKKFALHYETDTFMDFQDVPVEQDDIEMLSQIPQYKQFLEYLIKKHYGKYFEAYQNQQQ